MEWMLPFWLVFETNIHCYLSMEYLRNWWHLYYFLMNLQQSWNFCSRYRWAISHAWNVTSPAENVVTVFVAFPVSVSVEGSALFADADAKAWMTTDTCRRSNVACHLKTSNFFISIQILEMCWKVVYSFYVKLLNYPIWLKARYAELIHELITLHNHELIQR